MQIIIDGYNLLYNSPRYFSLAHQDLEKARQALLSDLALFGRQRGHKIIVIFDGWQEAHRQERKNIERGISVIYSRSGEKADEVIKRLSKEAKLETAIVTSDRGIIQALESRKVLTLGVEEFQRRLQVTREEETKNEEIEAETVKIKKGNPRKLPKAQRKKHKQWEKI